MITIVILTKNEEKNIVDCLESVVWADEIIIVDDNSEDRTIEVAKSVGNKKIKVYTRKLDDFSTQRNFALSKATKAWVLFIDADEIVSEQLKDEINSIIVNRIKDKNGYYIKRVDYMWGKQLNHGETKDLKLLRLLRRGNGIWMGNVHEILQVEGNVGDLEGVIKHFPHPTVSEFLGEINFYSTLRANELFANKVRTGQLEIFMFPIAKFMKNYFIKMGLLDGIAGLVFATMMSFHSFLVRGKLWLLWQKK